MDRRAAIFSQPSGTGQAGILMRLLDWWVGELRSFFPQAKARQRQAEDSDVELWIDGSGARLRRGPNPGHDGGLEAGSWRDLLALLQSSALSGKAEAATLRFGPPHVLTRRTSIPRAALARALEVLRLEMERVTPLRRGDVYDGWRMAEDDGSSPTLVLHHAVIKRSTVDPILADLRGLGLRRVRVTSATEGGPDVPIAVDGPGAPTSSPRLASLRTLNRLTACGLLVLLLAIPVIALARQRQAIASLDERIATVRTQAAEVQRKVEEARHAGAGMSALRSWRSGRVPATVLWEEVTRVLPDSAWLDEMQVDGDKVTVSGFAQSAAELIGLLEASPFFVEVAFLSPVIRAPREDAERFHVEFRAASPGAASAAAGPE